MRSRVYVSVGRLSVRPISGRRLLLWQVCCCGPGVGELIDCCTAGGPALSSKCGQCYVVS